MCVQSALTYGGAPCPCWRIATTCNKHYPLPWCASLQLHAQLSVQIQTGALGSPHPSHFNLKCWRCANGIALYASSRQGKTKKQKLQNSLFDLWDIQIPQMASAWPYQADLLAIDVLSSANDFWKWLDFKTVFIGHALFCCLAGGQFKNRWLIHLLVSAQPGKRI